MNIFLRVTPEAIETSVGPFRGLTVAELQARSRQRARPAPVLDTLVDRIAVRERDGGPWVDCEAYFCGSEDGA